ncbi:MAG: prepilin-type N-terminal cleavage/methylation domain-containing protein [Nitrospirota bacterium]
MGDHRQLKDTRGFTLIELLIVVAIVTILAAIAIPQFNSYRTRGYNSSALSDLRNARSAEEAFYSDCRVYSSSKADGSPGIGLPLTSASAPVTIAQFGISAEAPDDATTFTTGISQNVQLVISTSADGVSFVMASKNTAGDRCNGTDSDVTTLYWTNGQLGQAMSNASLPAAVDKANDLNGVAGTGICNGLTDGTGQKDWTAL